MMDGSAIRTGQVYTGTKILELTLYEIMLATLRDDWRSTLTRRNKPWMSPLVLASSPTR